MPTSHDQPQPPRSNATLQAPVSVAYAAHRPRPHFLDQIKGPGFPAKVELSRDSVVVGREQGVDILLSGDKVSRRHALLRRQNEEYTIIDLDSSHGIYLNSIKVYSAVLRDGDLLQLGDAVFIYHEG